MWHLNDNVVACCPDYEAYRDFDPRPWATPIFPPAYSRTWHRPLYYADGEFHPNTSLDSEFRRLGFHVEARQSISDTVDFFCTHFGLSPSICLMPAPLLSKIERFESGPFGSCMDYKLDDVTYSNILEELCQRAEEFRGKVGIYLPRDVDPRQAYEEARRFSADILFRPDSSDYCERELVERMATGYVDLHLDDIAQYIAEEHDKMVQQPYEIMPHLAPGILKRMIYHSCPDRFKEWFFHFGIFDEVYWAEREFYRQPLWEFFLKPKFSGFPIHQDNHPALTKEQVEAIHKMFLEKVGRNA